MQTCVSLCEDGFAIADVDGTDLFGPAELAMSARSLALTDEALWIVRENGKLSPATDWTTTTRGGEPVAYCVTVPGVTGGQAETRTAGKVLHFCIRPALASPWVRRSRLARASLSAELLAAVEVALRDVYASAPLAGRSRSRLSTVRPAPDLSQLGFSRATGFP